MIIGRLLYVWLHHAYIDFKGNSSIIIFGTFIDIFDCQILIFRLLFLTMAEEFNAFFSFLW